MVYLFSGLKRPDILKKLEREKFDLLVIGGGISGAGVALDAALRGLSVALLDMQDFAAGTSGRSTKLIHGGLRYLKQFEFRFVKETARERKILFQNAPHLIKPVRMLLPIYKNGPFGKRTISFGLQLYDAMARTEKYEKRVMMTKEETLQKIPLIKREGLLGAGMYTEYMTDDARLTIEVIKTAVNYGAIAINYVKADSFTYDDSGKINGVIARDVVTGNTVKITTRTVVNAAGPWVDHIRDLDGEIFRKRLKLSKGIHLVFDQRIFPLKHAVYFQNIDNRMIFAIPRGNKTYVGTTDTFYDGKPENVRITIADREYLLNAIRYMFPGLDIKPSAIESGWAGVRPLIYESGKSPSEISRKDEIWISDSGLISLAGGKLTGYRKMAEKTVNLVTKQIFHQERKIFKPCQTEHFSLSGGGLAKPEEFNEFIDRKGKEAKQCGFSEKEGRELAAIYGTNINQIFNLAKNFHEKKSPGISRVDYVRLMYAIYHEMTIKPSDYFVRRTGMLYFNRKLIIPIMEQIVHLMKEEYGWTEKTANQFLQELKEEVKFSVTPVSD